MTATQRDILLNLFQNAVSSVKGDTSVRNWIKSNDLNRPTHIVAVGKAAPAMFDGLPKDWRNSVPTFLVTKTDHLENHVFGENVVAFETSHPVPDQTSLDAGKELIAFVNECPTDAHLLMLVSGGASSLVEHLRQGVSKSDLIALTNGALAEGVDIAEINKRRKSISAIKGGGLLETFAGQQVDVLAISDVAGDDIAVIGSGIGQASQRRGYSYKNNIVASNAVARNEIESTANSFGIKTISNQENMYADVQEIAQRIAKEILDGPEGLYIFGGEPTVVLPENPGHGGRNQALALEVARHIIGRNDIVGLVAGTDGTDGPTNAAGGFVDGQSFIILPDAEAALLNADSGSYLARSDNALVTGPTGTNVMDLAIFLKRSS